MNNLIRILDEVYFITYEFNKEADA